MKNEKLKKKRKVMKHISQRAIAIIIYIFISISCNNTTAPIEKEEIKSPRDYSWSFDTVYKATSFQTLMSSIWGSDESNVYMCGWASSLNVNLWHYDGEKWEPLTQREDLGLAHRGILSAVDGSTANNVWIGGYRSRKDGSKFPFIINYNGTKWNMHELKEITSRIFDVFVESEERVWICGSNGIVANYNGIKWEVDTIKIDVKNNEDLQLSSIIVIDGIKYLRGIKKIEGSSEFHNYFYKIKDDIITLLKKDVITSGNPKKHFGDYFHRSKNNNLY